MSYSLSHSYIGESLLSGFNWFDGADPSNGFVAYQSRASALERGLYDVDHKTGVIRLGVDNVNTYALDQGRPSIRLESKQTFHHGLFIADFLHMPPSECGLWPAFWSYGNDWPKGGEVDILEGANTAQKNLISAHTTEGCSIAPPAKQNYLGEQTHVSCAVDSQNVGCGFNAAKSTSYGDGFNAAGGGVYAMQWDSDDIKVWHFARNEVPADVEARKPDPTKWKLPEAVFGGAGCKVDSYFKDMKLVINTNFCGDWGNAAWGTTDKCTQHASTCNEHVAKNPRAFANAYWDVRYIDAYELSSKIDNEHGGHYGRSLSVRSEGPIKSFQNSTSNMVPSVTVDESHASPVLTPVDIGGDKSQASSLSTAGNAVDDKMQVSTTSTAVNIIGDKSQANTSSAVDDAPKTIGKYGHLGCFGSRSGFQTFREVMESNHMTVQQCVDLCKDKGAFAGLFESKCLCADSMDAETKTVNSEAGVCDRSCPGAHDEVCGGLMKQQASVKIEWGSIGNWTSLVKSLSSEPAESAKFANSTDRAVARSNHAMRLPVSPAPLARRSVPGMVLLTVYGKAGNLTHGNAGQDDNAGTEISTMATPTATMDKLKAALISNGPVMASKAAQGVFEDLADFIGSIVTAETVQSPTTRAANKCNCGAKKEAHVHHGHGLHASRTLEASAAPAVTQPAVGCNLQTKIEATMTGVPSAEAVAQGDGDGALNATASQEPASPFTPDGGTNTASQTAIWNTQHFWTDPPALMSIAPRGRGSARLTAVLGATLVAAMMVMH
ncbi:hypothetical protein CDD82_4280 [Ophiocordyceps australis]|uniref:GH16 domain-containing protein n=1 Tax=Ophiocordyceps australis TaxID=1399860 RepID=A0A2C5Z7W0_9HYPO|nr:hypothetical protein CDD82_4280 [Ophiocordyceps australis]